MVRLYVGAILCGRHDWGRVEGPANAGLRLVPGIGVRLPPVHQLGQEGQHLLRVSKGVLRICGLDLQDPQSQCAAHTLQETSGRGRL